MKTDVKKLSFCKICLSILAMTAYLATTFGSCVAIGKYYNDDPNFIFLEHGTGGSEVADLSSAYIEKEIGNMRKITFIGFNVLRIDGSVHGEHVISIWENVGNGYFYNDVKGQPSKYRASASIEILAEISEAARKNATNKKKKNEISNIDDGIIKPISQKMEKTSIINSYNENGRNINVSIMQHGTYQTFSISEKGKTLFSYTPQFIVSYIGYATTFSVMSNGKIFYVYVVYTPEVKKDSGQVIIAGYDEAKGKYKTYVNSKDFYNPWIEESYSRVGASFSDYYSNDGKGIFYLAYYTPDLGSMNKEFMYIYELKYNPDKDSMEYNIHPIIKVSSVSSKIVND